MLDYYWNSLPIGKENAADYPTLCKKWNMSARKVRQTLHDLSLYDSGDNYILIRSGSGKGFFRTDDLKIIQAFKKECLSKAKSNFAPLKKINRIINDLDNAQLSFHNNLKATRISKGLKQTEVITHFQKVGECVDVSLLSKFENSVCLPTPYQLCILARVYGCSPQDLINTEALFNIA